MPNKAVEATGYRRLTADVPGMARNVWGASPHAR